MESNNKFKNKKVIKILIIIFTFSIILFSVIHIIYSKINLNHSSNNKTDSKNSAKKNTPSTEPPKEDLSQKKQTISNILLTSVGDCTLGSDTKFGFSGTLPDVLQQHNNDYSYLFKNVTDIFKNDDITTANLETTFTNATDRADKTFVFKGSPNYAKALTLASIEAVNISNNHIYDYKSKGFKDTIDTLKANNINYFGEGAKWTTNVRGIQIGFLGYTGFNDNADFLEKVKNDINELKSKGYLVAINFHWGIEGDYQPYNVQKHIAHFAIDNGADLIIGHHPHVIQSIEKYKDKIICYSLGNFCFGGNKNPEDKDTFIFQCKLNLKDNVLTSYDIRIIPCSISSEISSNDYCPTPLQGDRKTKLINKINHLSPSLGFEITDSFTNIDIKN